MKKKQEVDPSEALREEIAALKAAKASPRPQEPSISDLMTEIEKVKQTQRAQWVMFSAVEQAMAQGHLPGTAAYAEAVNATIARLAA